MSLLEVRNLVKHFPVRHGLTRRLAGHIAAVDGVSLVVGPGETLGLVGESGCGKSTVAKLITRLERPTSGSIHFAGRDLAGHGGTSQPPWGLGERRPCTRSAVTCRWSSKTPSPRSTPGTPSVRSSPAPTATRGWNPTSRPRSCWPGSAYGRSTPTAIPTSSPADKPNASALPGRWPCVRSWWCATSRSPRSTCRSRRRSSTC